MLQLFQSRLPVLLSVSTHLQNTYKVISPVLLSAY